jgi:hypothetical protein
MTKFEKGSMVFVEAFSADPFDIVGSRSCMVDNLAVTEADLAKRTVKIEWDYAGSVKGFSVDWGDGAKAVPVPVAKEPSASYTYPSLGGYLVRVTATCSDDSTDIEIFKVNLFE